MSDRDERLAFIRQWAQPYAHNMSGLTGDINFLLSELDAATQKLADYEMAARYPGDDQRHRGASVASQLVHAQHMREKAEAERDAALQNLTDADLAYDSASQEVQRQDVEIKALKAQVQCLTDALKAAPCVNAEIGGCENTLPDAPCPRCAALAEGEDTQ